MKWKSVNKNPVCNFCVSCRRYILKSIQINLWTFSIYFSALICDSLGAELIWTDSPAPLTPRSASSHRKLNELTPSKCTFFTLGLTRPIDESPIFFIGNQSADLYIYLSSLWLNNRYVTDVCWIVNWIRVIDSSTLHLFGKRFD